MTRIRCTSAAPRVSERVQRAGSRRRVVCGRVAWASCPGVISCRARAGMNPLPRISRRRKEFRPRSRRTTSVVLRRWGGYPSPPGFSQRRQFPGQTVVHSLVLGLRQAHQVPRCPGILGIVLCRPDVMHRSGLRGDPVPCRLASLELVTPQDRIPQVFPALALVSVPAHGLSPPCHPGKTKRPALPSSLWEN